MILNLIQSSVYTLDDIFCSLSNRLNVIDKVRVAMFVTWVWALFGLYVTKAFESFFRLLLKMPDSWLLFAAPNSQRVNKNYIKIVSAHNGTSDITNKFKLFLKYYWEEDEFNGGFSFDSFYRLLNCSMLYCSYLMTDSNGSITPEKFWRNVDKFLVEMRDDKCFKYTSDTLQNVKQVPFNMVNFTTNDRHERDISNKDIINLINSINS